MRPIALARVRLHGTGHNICGISAQTFVAMRGAMRGDQTQGVVDHITLLDDGVLLFEREGKRSELIPIQSVATMMPVEDLSAERLGDEYIAKRADKVAEWRAKQAEEAAKKNAEMVALNTDAASVAANDDKPSDALDVVKKTFGRKKKQ